ncbi:MAG TPA: hypothetical protein VMS63_06820 [Gaiellaceae bacterium]|jgi:hypothetical protein|nr:hypothetical protein [Gaiellaceae bacterium]
MPTRKQKRREAKSKRHEYEFVYLDAEGNEVEGPPEELVPTRSKASSNGAKPAAAKQPAQPARGRREPQPPSWGRAGKRALLLGAVVFALFALTNRKGGYAAALPLALIYTALFVPFTYMVDRFAYRRYQARKESGASASPRQAKKR